MVGGAESSEVGNSEISSGIISSSSRRNAGPLKSVMKSMKAILPIAGLVYIGNMVATYGQNAFIDCNVTSVCTRLGLTVIYAFGMEYVARYYHRYLWHSSALWWLHGTHHHQEPEFGSVPKYDHGNKYVDFTFELNDIFPIFFGAIATPLCFYGGTAPSYVAKDCWAGIAMGATVYGFTYFMGHDIVAHERMGKDVAQYLRKLSPTIAAAADLHQRNHHKLKKDAPDDPYGPPYGFWLGEEEIIGWKEKGLDYTPMPFAWAVVLKSTFAVTVGSTLYALVA